MRILLTSVGSAGDIHPFIAVGLVLKARGHDVALAANPYFQDSITATGLEFLPLGDLLNPQEVARAHPKAFRRYTGAKTLFREVFGPHMRDMIMALRDIARDANPEVIVGHQISFGGPWIAADLGVPWITTVLAPSTLISDHDPSVYPIGMDVRRAPMWVRRLQHFAGRRTVNAMLDPLLQDIRTEMGHPRRSDTLFGEMLEGHVIGLFSPSYRGPAPDDPPGMTICGFPWFDRGSASAPLDPALESFLDAGPAPVVIAMGSVLSQTESAVLRRVVRASQRTGHRIVLVGRDGHNDATDSRNIIRIDYAPFGALFPRAAMIVHHGGIGTTAQTLRAGVPALVLAFAHDQFDNAARTHHLGLGARGTRNTAQRTIAAHIDRLITDPAMRDRCRAMATAIAAEDGATRAAEVIEAIR